PPPPPPPAAPVAVVTPALVPPPVIAAPVVATPPPAASPSVSTEGQRRRAPSLVVDFGEQAQPKPPNGTTAAGRNALNGDEQFASRVGGTTAPERSRATLLRNQPTTIAQGALIPAVLETALNSDLPGFTRAVVSRDVRSFDGTQVLIPRGSRLIGEYRSGVAQGASRAFVIWTRVIRPDGASIQIGSSGTDDLGRAGLAGKVDRHFFERFSGALLLSIIQLGGAALTSGNTTSVVIGSSGEGALGGAASAFTPQNISPTIKVPQGTPILVFVARDLDFTPVEPDR
ncbi:MAG: TrbI/VirB10 family protein, partial [Caulobacteraceae bacterium]|nr:TrbI/VirB10 family protein [Caulobacter sp.]